MEGADMKRGETSLRRLAIFGIPLLLVTSLFVVATTREARAGGSTDAIIVTVSGNPVTNVVTTPLAISPTFSQTTTDYVLRCQSGSNPIQVTIFRSHGTNATLQETLVENQALVLQTKLATYWIRCLPHDFPNLTVTKPGNPPSGWYLTGNILPPQGGSSYAMILDNNGTPVWYRKGAKPGIVDVTLLNDGTIAWTNFPCPPCVGFGTDPNGAWEDYNLSTQATRFLSPPIPPVDLHEIQPMSNGDLMMLASPLTPNVDLTPLGLSSSATIVDCVVQEVNPSGQLVWQWRASQHLLPAESTQDGSATVRRQLAFDIYHCNSVDTDPVSGNVLVSFRNTSAVYLINKTSGTVMWKMGGKPLNHDLAKIITVTGDPEGVFNSQHDARFQPNSDVSLYDDHSVTGPTTINAARGVEYHVDTVAGTATLVFSFSSPDGHNSAATGSFRRLSSGTDNVIGWGIKPNTLFTEVDSGGSVQLNVTMPNQFVYRVIKVAPTAIDHNLLRNTAGLPPFVLTPTPTVAFLGPSSGPAGSTVNITGAGFTGATGVSFGSNTATAFTVGSDNSITATAPSGTGTVNVVVTGPGGASSTVPANQLAATASDSSFESGTGSWMAGGNSSIALSNARDRTGTFSLKVSPIAAGAISALTGQYSVPAGAQVMGSAWVLTPSGANLVQATVTFYNSSGAAIASNQGPLSTSSTGSWVQVSETAIAPAGAAFAAIGVGDGAPSGPIYIDDASLSGSDQFTYH